MIKLKDSGIEWIGQIPEHWEVKRIRHIVQERNEKNENLQTTTMLSLSAKKGVTLYDEEESHSGNRPREDLSGYKVVQPGDIVVNSMNILSGSVGLSKYTGCVSPVYYMYETRKEYSRAFVYDIFQSKQFQLSLRGLGNGILIKESENGTLNTIRTRIPSKKLLNEYFPVPPKEEQQRIADFLDKKCSQIERLIKLQENEIEKLKEYKQSIISETIAKDFDSADLIETGMGWIDKIPSHWSIVPIKTLFTFGKGLPITKENLTESGVNVISYGQVHSKTNACVRVDDSLYRFVSEDYLNSNPECLVKKGDFIFADTSEDVAGTGDFVHIDNNVTTFAGYHSIILRNKNKNNSKYLAYQFMTDNWRHQIRSKVSGVKLFSLTKKILGQAMVIIPSKEEQDAVVNKLESKCDKIDKLIEIKKDKIEKLADYKKSLIYECVTGKKEI